MSFKLSQLLRFAIATFSILVFLLALVIVTKALPYNEEQNNNLSSNSCSGASLQKASFTLDGVNIDLCSPYLPAKTFNVAQPNDFEQEASNSTWSPYKEFTIKTFPYGRKPGSEIFPVSQAQSEKPYRNALEDFRKSQGAKFKPAPTLNVFGKQVVGLYSIVDLHIGSTSLKPTAIIEWVIEAGNRIWIVRVAQEITISLNLDQINSLNGITINSPNLNTPATSMQKSALTQPNSAVSTNNLQAPAWWNGDCDLVTYKTGAGIDSYRLGATYLGTPACGPRPYAGYENAPDVTVHFFSGAFGVLEWECVEMSMRVLYLQYGVHPYSANGYQVVDNYSTSDGGNLTKIPNGTVNAAPQPGDVLAYGPASTNGHTSVVSTSTIDNNGNGSITVVEENSSASGTKNISVNNWVVGLTVTGWLHDLSSDCKYVSKTIDDYTCGTLRYALNVAGSGSQKIVTIALASGSTISLSSGLIVPAGVTLNGSCSNNSPAITLNGGGAAGNGLTLSGDDIINGINVIGFSGYQIYSQPSSGGFNNLTCVSSSS